MTDTRKPAESNSPDEKAGARTSVPSRERNPGRVKHGLVALSSAVVLSIYSAGYLRTQAAADRFASEESDRRPARPVPAFDPGAAPAPTLPAATGSSVAPAAPVTTTHEIARKSIEPSAAPVTSAPTSAEAAATETTAPNAPATVMRVATPTIGTAPTPPVSPSPVATVAEPVMPTATANATAPAAVASPAAPAAPRYKDGTFAGWGTSRHGDILASVVIEGGRITSAKIAQCETRWPCSWIEMLPAQVVTRQSAETDYVSGATQSTNAFYYAVVEALAKAKVQ